mmetsp:Transcript_38506/g.97429  ORF Transcript_38506/g.97429 Transcript_38506/m.97429 type:complete len:88 (+) Transcript_38506:173-436(+)|eukprot:jgi/Tetstr1/443664/TSEL_031656.t1
MEDRANGALILLVAGGAFAYVTAWLLLTPLLEGNPFVSDDLPLLSIFPPREWAISAAACAGVALLSAVMWVIGWELVRSQLPGFDQG